MNTIIFPRSGTWDKQALVHQYESAYQNKIAQAARLALEKHVRFVFLAGPSCSGKTTTSLELIRALEGAGKRVLSFSTDDFFFNRELAKRNEDGTPDFDTFEHTDSKLIISTLHLLSEGKTTNLPVYDFTIGKRSEQTILVDPKDYDIFILEGIHALNDVILDAMPEKVPYLCFYLDVSSGVKLAGESTFLTADEVRFCRRLIRDFKHRGANADRSFSLWKHVLRNEKIILHPFRKNALFTITTDFCYEIAVEKEEVCALLDKVDPNGPFLKKAKELQKKLAPFPSWERALVPKNSVLREFID